MRLNSLSRNLPNENSSAFYSAFAGAFDTILDPRPIQDSTWAKYVPVESSEKGLKSFINSSVDVTTKGILLFKGGQGTGKSSTLFEIHRQYRDKKTTRSLLVDLRQHGSKIPDTLGSIAKLDDRVNACIPRVRELLSSRFEGACRRPLVDLNIDGDEVTLEVFKYCFHHHLHVLPVQLRNSPHVREDGDAAELLSAIKGYLQSDFSFHDAFCFVKYIYIGVKYQNLRKFTVIIDNGDQLPYEMMEAAVFCANHYSGCLNSSRPRRSKNDGVVVGKAKINFIIACRHHNYEKLVARSNVNALGSHSHKALTHAGIPRLSKIIRRRIRQTKKIGEYTFSSGIRLSDVNARRAIYAYFRQLEDSGCFDQIMAIHNRNLADAFDCIRAVTRNPIFPKFDQFVQDFAIKRSNDRRYTVPLNALIVLRCLVWGSPRSFSEAMYPTLPSDIPRHSPSGLPFEVRIA